MCRVYLPQDGTHCPRCGMRVAALPRPPRLDRPRRAPAITSRMPALAANPRRAALQGAGAGAIVVAVAALCGLVVGLAGGPGRAAAGDGLLGCGGLLVLVAVLMPGLHLARWAEASVMRERATTAHRVDPRRAFVLGAAAACALGVVAVAAFP
jgi:hypothetical protein